MVHCKSSSLDLDQCLPSIVKLLVDYNTPPSSGALPFIVFRKARAIYKTADTTQHEQHKKFSSKSVIVLNKTKLKK